MQPKVSMVIPCYNKERYIGKMLQSIYNQVWDNVEVVFVDDGSTDKTADIIQQWVPRLQRRGYEVIFITQKNQGVTGAVLNGLLHMTGEFFCQVDCDDILHPEYISSMASFLCDNADYDWVSCDYESFYMDDAMKSPVKQIFADAPESMHMLESFLLLRICLSVWVYMVRVEYIKRCRLIENFRTEPPISQEPPIIIPLAAGGGRIKHLPVVLYKYNLSSANSGRASTIASIQSFISQYAKLSQDTINLLNISEQKRERLLAITRLGHTKWLHLASAGLCKAEEQRLLMIEKTVNSMKHMLAPVPTIDLETVIRVGISAFFYAVEGCALKLNNKFLNTAAELNPIGRVIGYGSLSWRAPSFLQALQDTPMQPDLLWDKAASAESTQNGVAVVKPDLSHLTPDDTILIFSSNLYIIDDVKAIANNYGVIKVWGYFDILEYLAAYYFRDIQENCTFVG